MSHHSFSHSRQQTPPPMADDHDPGDETPNHHLPPLDNNHHLPPFSDPENNNDHLPPLSDPENNRHPPRLYDRENSRQHDHHPPRFYDRENSHHKAAADPEKPPHHYQHQQPQGFYNPRPKPLRRHSPPPSPHRRSSNAGPFAAIATLLLLLALTALILFLVYRPTTPHFTVVAASIYHLNTTSATIATNPPPPSLLAASMQFTILTRNPSRRTSLAYDHLSATLYYREQAITPPTPLPPLYHHHRRSVLFSPTLGGDMAVPVSPGVAEGLAADESYGVMGLRVVIMGRVRYHAGSIKTSHYGVYVSCDLLVGVKKGVVGPVPLLANPDCKVDI